MARTCAGFRDSLGSRSLARSCGGVIILAAASPDLSGTANSYLMPRTGLEGIVSKRKHAPYKSGQCDWIKVKCTQWREQNNDRGDLFMRFSHHAAAKLAD